MPPEVFDVLRPWSRLRGGGRETLLPETAWLAAISRRFDLESLDRLVVDLTYDAWMDGARVRGRIEADAGRLCGVSLEPFVERVEAELDLRFVPEGSPNAPSPEVELVVDLDADDPPEVAPVEGVDLAPYIVEAVGLALNPFPRAPGAVFAHVDRPSDTSPFSVLSRLSTGSDGDS